MNPTNIQACPGVITALEDITNQKNTTITTKEIEYLEKQWLIETMNALEYNHIKQETEKIPGIQTNINTISETIGELSREKEKEETKGTYRLFNKTKQVREEVQRERKIEYYNKEIEQLETKREDGEKQIGTLLEKEKIIKQFVKAGKQYIQISEEGKRKLKDLKQRVQLINKEIIIIGEQDISQYLKEKTTKTKEKEDLLTQKIREIESKNTTQMEENMIMIIKNKIISSKYKELDTNLLQTTNLDILNKGNLYTLKDKKFPYPKYGIFKITNEKEESTFKVKILKQGRNGSYNKLAFTLSNTPSILKEKLFEKIKNYFEANPCTDNDWDFSLIEKTYLIETNFNQGEHIVNFEIENACILPKTTKEKIETARNDFGEEIYMINEIKSWTETNIITEPSIIIGLYIKQAYLIDNFIPEKIL
ncbi:MAG: hypothetical protein KKB65_01145 [Nanoarchaeota archaeon]|nr:hypothetical protein [Nanoarchaeota archaeon]